MKTPSLLLFALSACCGSALAQSVIVPNSAASVGTGNTVNTLLRNAGNPRTYQMGIAAAELAGIPVGSVVTGLSFRGAVSTANPAAWPPSDTTWTNYDVTIGNGIPLGTWTGTYATNFSGTPVAARSGAMVIETGVFPNTAVLPAPNAWGEFYWDLQKPFVYTGGDLAILFAHNGSSQATSALYLEYNISPPNTIAYSSAAYPSTSGTVNTAFCVIRIHYGYGSGCPGTGGMVPNLVLTNDVKGGGTATFAAANGLASAPAAFVIGANQLSVSLPFGCTLLNDAVVAVPTTLSNYGRAKISGTFPAGVAGVVYGQLFVVDAGAPFGIAASLGAKLTIKP